MQSRRIIPLTARGGAFVTLVTLGIAGILGVVAVLDESHEAAAFGTGIGVAVVVFLSGATIVCGLACLARERIAHHRRLRAPRSRACSRSTSSCLRSGATSATRPMRRSLESPPRGRSSRSSPLGSRSPSTLVRLARLLYRAAAPRSLRGVDLDLAHRNRRRHVLGAGRRARGCIRCRRATTTTSACSASYSWSLCFWFAAMAADRMTRPAPAD